MSVECTPIWLRFFQITAGIIAIVLSGAVLAGLVSAVFTVTLLYFSIALIFLGIERITVGVTSSGGSKESRIGNIVLGVIAIAVSGLPIAFPLFAFEREINNSIFDFIWIAIYWYWTNNARYLIQNSR